VTRFFHLYFRGGRYDALHGLPLADLPALAKLEDLVRSVARDLFFDGNDGRQRVSAGFDEAFQPRITEVEGGGSADCEVAWSPTPDDDNAQYYEAAQTEIVDILYNVANHRPDFPPWLSKKSARLLADCLDLLHDNETVAISAATLEPVTVGTEQREIVRLEANRVREEVEERYRVVGRLHALVDDANTAVRVYVWETRRTVTVPVAPELEAMCIQAWPRRESTLVRLVGRAFRSAERRRFEAATELEIIEGPPLAPRLAELGKIEDGWLDELEGESKGPSGRFLHTVERALWGMVERVGVDRPHLFLMPEGGVEALWKDAERTTTLRFLPTGGLVTGAAVHRGKREAVLLEAQPLGEAVDTWLGTHARRRA
jgi:hypothetical protein